ncbi:MAG: hypothetical protein FWF92_03510 [Oscillospiraceae bacterium]|nr:hypothetical protein [Oscillospiraceae bacterium]
MDLPNNKNANKNFRNRLYIIITCTIFLFLFLWCPLTYILDKTGVLKSEDIKNYKIPDKIYTSGAFAGVLNKIEEGKAELDNLYTNYLPMYGGIVTFLKTADSDMSYAFTDLLENISKNSSSADSINLLNSDNPNDNNENEELSIIDEIEFSTMMVINDGLHKYYAISPSDSNEDRIESFIDTALSFPEETLRANMEKQIEHINRISAATVKSNANFYLYIGKRMQDAEYFTKIIPNEISTASYFNEFMDRIENTKGKSALDVDTLEKRMENIFRTDHHWSALGAYSGYCDIIDMISKVSPEIGAPVKLNGLISYDGVQMRGSASRISSFQRFYETFTVMDIDLPENNKYNISDVIGEYENGTFNKSRFADHYEIYYKRRNKYTYETNNTGRKLLIIGDSFTWGSAWLIAANFDETYLYYPWDRKKIYLNEYIAENGITDVLCMLFSDRILFNIYDDCPLKNILTD